MTQDEQAPTSLTFGREATRKMLHVATVAIPFLYSRDLSRDAVVAVLAAGTAFAVLVESVRLTSPRARTSFERAFGALLRNRERTRVTGATWLLASCLAAVVLLPRPAAVAALWCVAAGDPAATLAGRGFGALRGAGIASGKTLVGSAACFITSLIGVWKLAHFSGEAASIIALAATIAERLPLSLDDNLRVVTAAGVTAWLLS